VEGKNRGNLIKPAEGDAVGKFSETEAPETGGFRRKF